MDRPAETAPLGSPPPTGAPAGPTLGYWPAGPGPDGSGWPSPPAGPAGGRGGRAATVVAIVVVLVAMALGAFVGHYTWTRLSTPTATVPPASVPSGSSAAGAPADAASVAAATDPGLVDIDVVDRYQAVEGAATGMVLRAGGEVLTNNHVVEGATTITVTDVGDHHTYDATVVGYDPTQDVAVLQLTGASDLRTVRLGPTATVRVGTGVVAVGNAEGAGGTPSWSAGSVTAIDQTISAEDEATGATETLTGLIETNATIVPGDSGGALVDAAGSVIGMDTATSQGFEFQPGETQGYAIPIAHALTIADQIEAGQASATVHVGPTAFLGVDVQPLRFGAAGALVVAVFGGSPAAQAGLVAGDVITAVDGRAVSSPQSLTGQLLGDTPGTTVALTYLDTAGATQHTSVHLVAGPAQ